MARVRLNGKDLGTVWCAPWGVEIGSAAKEKGNELEIDVANLRPNRLIGDQAWLMEKRVSWTTWNPYQQDSALTSSGLLEPVTDSSPRCLPAWDPPTADSQPETDSRNVALVATTEFVFVERGVQFREARRSGWQ